MLNSNSLKIILLQEDISPLCISMSVCLKNSTLTVVAGLSAIEPNALKHNFKVFKKQHAKFLYKIPVLVSLHFNYQI